MGGLYILVELYYDIEAAVYIWVGAEMSTPKMSTPKTSTPKMSNILGTDILA